MSAEQQKMQQQLLQAQQQLQMQQKLQEVSYHSLTCYMVIDINMTTVVYTDYPAFDRFMLGEMYEKPRIINVKDRGKML